MTEQELRQKLTAYVEKHGLKMASIASYLHPNPFKEYVGGKTVDKFYKGQYVSKGTLALLEQFFTKQDNNI